MCGRARRTSRSATYQESDSANTAASSSSKKTPRRDPGRPALQEAPRGDVHRRRRRRRATRRRGRHRVERRRCRKRRLGHRRRSQTKPCPAPNGVAPVPLLLFVGGEQAATRRARRREAGGRSPRAAGRRARRVARGTSAPGTRRRDERRVFRSNRDLISSADGCVQARRGGPVVVSAISISRARAVSRHGGAARLAVRVKSSQDVVRRGDASERHRRVRCLRGGRSVLDLRGGDELSRNLPTKNFPTGCTAVLVSSPASRPPEGSTNGGGSGSFASYSRRFRFSSAATHRDASARAFAASASVSSTTSFCARSASRAESSSFQRPTSTSGVVANTLDASLQIGDARFERFHPRDETVVRVTRTVVPLVKRRHVHQVQQRTTRRRVDGGSSLRSSTRRL